jgi:hypothetical protein
MFVVVFTTSRTAGYGSAVCLLKECPVLGLFYFPLDKVIAKNSF